MDKGQNTTSLSRVFLKCPSATHQQGSKVSKLLSLLHIYKVKAHVLACNYFQSTAQDTVEDVEEEEEAIKANSN